MQYIIEYFSANMWQMWTIVCLLCLLAELFSGDFFIMCFALGGVVTAIVSVFCGSLYAQLAIFAITSVLCIFFVRPFALKCLHSGEGRLSNAEAIIGRIGVVSTTIPDHGYGRVALDGDDWKANSIDGEQIEEGARVKIISLDSIIITVERVI